VLRPSVDAVRLDKTLMAIAHSLRFKILDLGRRIIFARDWIAGGVGRLSGRNGSRLVQIPAAGSEVRFASGQRLVTGWLVAQDGPLLATVLLFHGIGDRSSSWRGVQLRLAEAGVRSLIFHYPGYGGNTADPSLANMEADARAAYAWVVEHNPLGSPVFLFGFSLGSGLSADVAPSLRPVPAGLILSEGFTTLREAAKRAAWPATPLGYLVPDVWRTCDSVGALEMPLYVIHSSGDRLFPTSMADELYASARRSGVDAAMEVFAGYPHDAVYRQVPRDYWIAVVNFISRVSGRAGG